MTRPVQRADGRTTTPARIRLGARIRRERLKARLSLRDLAKLLGVAPSHVSHIEHGLVGTSARLLREIERRLPGSTTGAVCCECGRPLR